VLPQVIPAGTLVTVPLPVPALLTVRKTSGWNVAVTLVAAESVTVQVPVPLHPPPLQPANVEPEAAAAAKVTLAPLVKPTEQAVPQLMPVGLLVTVPLPVPAGVTVSVAVWRSKVAVTVASAPADKRHVPVPVQPLPVQPANVEPLAAVAVKVTGVPLVKLAEQVLPQLIPAGLLVTVPLPAPTFVTVCVMVFRLKVAVTVVAVVTVTKQEPVPVQPPPLQPANVEPPAAVAVRVTGVPQVLPQVIPPVLLVTVPLPVPSLRTERVSGRLKVAVTPVAAESVTMQVPVPLQPPPLQPANVEPLAAAAVRVTLAPLVKLAEQVPPLLLHPVMPDGLLVTVPPPLPLGVTVNVNVWILKVAVTVVAAVTVTVQVAVP
jgi:hypothetical protein